MTAPEADRRPTAHCISRFERLPTAPAASASRRSHPTLARRSVGAFYPAINPFPWATAPQRKPRWTSGIVSSPDVQSRRSPSLQSQCETPQPPHWVRALHLGCLP